MRPPLSQSLTDGQRRALNEAARVEACRRGELRFLLHASQREVLQQFESTSGRFVLEKGRRWGGTWFLLVLAFMFCFRKPNTRVVYGAPTLKFLKEFVLPTLEKIRLLLPEAYRPHWNQQNSHIECHNGSYVHLFGCDDQRQADTGAGSDADLAIFDEAGATGVASLLTYIVGSIFEPQLMANIDRPVPGRMILGSSPPRIPEHVFVELADLALAAGCYAHRSIHDNPRMTPGMIQELIERKAKDEGLSSEAFVKSETWRREYLAERVIDPVLVAIPDWLEVRDTQFVALPRPKFFDATVGIDPGGNDPYYLAFTYWDFQRAALVVEDEILFRNAPHSGDVVAAAKAKERELYGTDSWTGTLHAFQRTNNKLWETTPDWLKDKWDMDAPRQPYVRWSDNNIDFCKSLYGLHGYAAIPTSKGTLELMNNETRVLVAERKVFVHPRCVAMDRHLRTATWANHRRQEYARRAGEHADGLATLNYVVRNVDRTRNPTPVWDAPRESAADRLAKAFHRRR